jgi:predicted ABC-type ATPase
VADDDPLPCIYVLAGTNGAGKSSIGGAMFRQAGAEYFNPDEAARLIRSANPGIIQAEANSAAWQEGKRLLERAITSRCNFAFETTLGGNTIPRLLAQALSLGIEVRIWYAGLRTLELHIARVRSRVDKGGHDIPEADIRRRFEAGRLNLIRLLPKLTELRMYDNSAELDPDTGHAPDPQLVLHMKRGTIVNPRDLRLTPGWAKPIVAAALKLATR